MSGQIKFCSKKKEKIVAYSVLLLLWILYFFVLIYFIFTGKSDIQRGGETERKIFLLMIHSTSGSNGWSWANSKSGVQSLFWVSHASAGYQGFGLSSTAFPGQKQGAGWEVELLGLELAPMWEIRKKFLAAGFELAQLQPLRPLGEWVTGRKIFLSVSPPLCISDFAIKINKSLSFF